MGALSDGSPVRGLLAELGGGVVDGVEQALLSGVARGANPRVIAREVARVGAGGLNRALRISRTEVIRAHREATRRTFQTNDDVLEGWRWHSALDKRTCPSCFALHGSLHRSDARLDSHPACRCVMIPAVLPWSDLGFPGVADRRPRVRGGTELFLERGEAFQRSVLGTDVAFQAFKSGEVMLVDFVARRADPRWGSMRYARSLRAVRENRGGFQLGEGALPRGV